jgi:hypothetical protein
MLGGLPFRAGVAVLLFSGLWLTLSAQDGLDVETLVGILSPPRPSIPIAQARQKCIDVPVPPPADRPLVGPHGDKLLAERCEVVSFGPIEKAPAGWFAAHNRWTSEFTAEDPARGPSARDVIVEEEVVLLDSRSPGQIRAVWHERFESDEHGVWRSITPEIAAAPASSTLFSVMRCVNGTGGCAQDFLLLRADGRWVAVRQEWMKQLPAGYFGRIRHGTRINPVTLAGEAGFYGDADPNCCPGQILTVNLALRGDALVLVSQKVGSDK